MLHATRLLRLATITLAGAALGACARASRSASDSPTAALASMAAPGDTLWMGVNYIKPERRREYEAALAAFWGGGMQLGARDPLILETFRRTRVFYPVKPEPDGTYIYVYLADPKLKGASYDIPTLLRRMYPAARADSIARVISEAAARPQQYVVLTQGFLNR